MRKGPTFAEKKEMAMDCYQVNMYAFEEMMTYLCGLDWQAENAGGLNRNNRR